MLARVALAAVCLSLTGAAGAAADPTLYFQQARTIASLDAASPGPVTAVVPRVAEETFGLSVGDGFVFWIQGNVSKLPLRGRLWRADLNGRNAHAIVANVPLDTPTVVLGAFVYWGDDHGISAAALDGTRVRRNMIRLPVERGGGVAEGLATDGRFLYFSRCQDGAIGRADPDGRDVIRRFVFAGRHACPQGIAIGGDEIYWTEIGTSHAHPNRLGRATLSATGVDDDWLHVGGELGPFSVAADGASVFWTTSLSQAEGGTGFIGTARSDRTHIRRRIVADPSIESLALSLGPPV